MTPSPIRSFDRRDRPVELDGASPAVVRDVLDSAEPVAGLLGADGFAGAVDGWLVRDTLGRRLIYYDADEPARCAFSPQPLSRPQLLPAGHGLAPGDTRPRRLLRLPAPPADDREPAVERVRQTTRTAVEAVEAGAVAFSGGLDSAFVAAGVPDASLYVAGFENAHDRAAAREAASAAGRGDHLTEIELTHADLKRAVRAVVRATGLANPMDVSIAVPLWLVGRRAAADGHDRLALGQGADELFGGYAKVVDPADDSRVAADTVRGARRETVVSLPDQLARDVCTLRAAGVEPVVPFLTDAVIRAALRLPPDAIATADGRKLALRAAADGLVPDAARTADKKALQYGTYVSRELDRLARQAGFKRRMSDHVGRYLRRLVAGDLQRTDD